MKKVIFLSFIFCAVISSLLFMQCARGSNKTLAVVKPPFKSFTLPSLKTVIDPVKGGVVKVSNGSTIEIPALAFVDEAGNIVQTPVTINYEQYQSPAEVIACGIPMNYDSAGSFINFETAGMFKMNATTLDHKQVNIAPGKSLEVNVCSNVKGNQYNFYYFNEEKGNWEYQGRNDPKPNEEKAKAIAAVTDACVDPSAIKEANAGKPVFDLNVDYTVNPELKVYEQSVWECAPGYTPNEELAIVEKLKQNKGKMEIELVDNAKSIFKLTLISAKEKFSAKIQPVMNEREMAAAKAEYAKQRRAYELKQQQQNNMVLSEANMQGDLYRSFRVANFGIYNWDCNYRRSDLVSCRLNPGFTEKDIDEHALTYYLINEDKKVVCYYYDDLQTRFSLDPKRNNRVFCVINGSKIALAKIDPMDPNTVTQITSEKKLSCDFKMLPYDITRLEDLESFIKSL